MLSKSPRRLGISLALVVAALATASPASAAVIDSGGCGTGGVVNLTSTSCSFTLQCPNGCSYSARLHVAGVGLVGGRLAATPNTHCATTVIAGPPVVVPCDARFPAPPAAPPADSCTHLLSCEAATGGAFANRTNVDELGLLGFTRVVDSIRVTCTETGPAILEHAACTGETVK